MPRKITRKEISSLWLIPVLLVGFFFRLYNNTAVALWHDEAFSALYVRDYSWSEMMYRIGLDVHPPLYYWLLRIWTFPFGMGLISLRGFSILFGVLTVWAAYLLVKKAFGNQTLGLLAALLVALNPFQAQYALEARMYTLGTFLILYSSYWLLKALDTKRWKDWIIYGVLAAACIYTHYYLIFSVAAQGLYLVYWLFKNKQVNSGILKNQTIRVIGAYALSFILFLPWLKQFLIQRSRVEHQYWIPPMDRWSIPSTIWKMIFGGQGIRHLILEIATIITIVIIYLFIRRIKNQEKWLILFGLLVPFVASILLSLQTALYLDRYFVFASLYFTILVACILYQIPRPQMRQAIAVLFITAMVFTFFKNWRDMKIKNIFIDRSQNFRPGMAAASAVVNEYARPGDRIYVGSSFVYFTFRYYNHTGISPKLISSGPLESIPHFSGTALLSPNDLVLNDTIFNKSEVERNDTVWLVWTTGFGSNKPNVPGSWSTVAEYQYPDAPGFKGDIYITQYHVN
ncbi:MAG: glycosyltransferase family 39 protein [Candidatus Doudnabacteria bacterium]|nr:glycosyltransferase family 39 protein [Candidatus Doudnabacteria bacterium]